MGNEGYTYGAVRGERCRARSLALERETMPMGTHDRKDRAAEFVAASALAKERFAALQDAFDALENAHQRGDYSRRPDFYQRLAEFRCAASEVHRLVREIRPAFGSRPDVSPTE